MKVNENLSPSEWNLMECLWESSPRTGREAVDYMAETVGWTRSTTLTMLRRMSEKGLIECFQQDGLNVYAPLVDRNQAADHQTADFIERVYHGSLSMMVSALTKKQSLSREEIDELYEILRQAEEAK